MAQQSRLTDVDAGRTPFGVNLALGAVAMVGVTLLAGVCTTSPVGRLLLVTAAAGVFAAKVADTRASLLTALIGFLLFDGFLVNRYGELTWDGTATAWNLMVFAVAVGLGLGQRWIRHVQAQGAFTTEPTDLFRASASGARKAG